MGENQAVLWHLESSVQSSDSEPLCGADEETEALG